MGTTNTSLDTAISDIRSGQQGPAIAAFFDFTAVSDSGSRYRGLLRGRDRKVAQLLLTGIPRDGGDAAYGRYLHTAGELLAGRTEDELAALGDRLFRRAGYGRLYPEAWRLIAAHRAAGHTIVLISSLTEFQVAPAAAVLGIDHVLCTRMVVVDGRLTGQPADKVLWRQRKADAAAEFAAADGVALENSYAYTGAAADLPLLSLVGHPCTTSPDTGLVTAATERDLPLLTFRPRNPPDPGDYARTFAGFGGLIGGSLFGVLVKSYTRQRRPMADSLMKYGTAATLRLCGVRLRVTGQEHARTPRPAVFVFNHQSQFDVIIVPAVLQGGVTGIGKKELTRNPVFGPLMRFVGVTFIDRGDTARAKASLEPVVATLRDGLSIAVAPEGTRSYTPEVGPFKKGAFHIALQAGVPVIPVIIRNAGELSWRDSMIVRRGTVDVAIGEPIDVSGWDPADMHDEVAAVRQLFIDTLLDWPS